MAIWVDISHLEPPSDDEDNSVESGYCVNPAKMCSKSKPSTQDFSYHQDHTTTTPTESAPDEEKTSPVDVFEICAQEIPMVERSSASVTQEYDYHCLRDLPRPQDLTEELESRATSRKRETNVDQKTNQLDVRGIKFRTTSPDGMTVTTNSDYEEGMSVLNAANTGSAQNSSPQNIHNLHGGHESKLQHANLAERSTDTGASSDGQDDTIGLGIETEDTLHHRRSTCPLVFTTEADERLAFLNVDEEEFNVLLAASYAYEATRPADKVPNPPDGRDHWVEFEYQDSSQWNIIGLDSADSIIDGLIDEDILELAPTPELRHNVEDHDVYESSNTHAQHDPEDNELDTSPNALESEDDLPLSHFQPLSIGPFAKTSPPTSPSPSPPPNFFSTPSPPRNHHHPFPTLTRNPTTGTINVTHTVDEHWNCPVFVFTRHVADVSGAPVPLSRRIYELQGLVEEDRRGMRESWRYRRGWSGVRSSLRRGERVEVEGENRWKGEGGKDADRDGDGESLVGNEIDNRGSLR